MNVEYIFPSIPQKKLKDNNVSRINLDIYDNLEQPKKASVYEKLSVSVERNAYISKPVEPKKKPKNVNFIITNRKKLILSVGVIGMLLIGGLILLILFLASKHKTFFMTV